eukprot:8881149-Heterocapsa_arctica.AAC.1
MRLPAPLADMHPLLRADLAAAVSRPAPRVADVMPVASPEEAAVSPLRAAVLVLAAALAFLAFPA